MVAKKTATEDRVVPLASVKGIILGMDLIFKSKSFEMKKLSSVSRKYAMNHSKIEIRDSFHL